MGKKIHSQKCLIISNEKREILYISSLYCGKTHDYEVFKKIIPKTSPCFTHQTVVVDLGFLGIKTDYAINNLHIPHKKKRVKKGESNELTEEQKRENKEIGKERIVVEHSIGEIKKCKILHQTIRIKKQECMEKLVGIAAALANLRIRK